jgi:hypothetical protein
MVGSKNPQYTHMRLLSSEVLSHIAQKINISTIPGTMEIVTTTDLNILEGQKHSRKAPKPPRK